MRKTKSIKLSDSPQSKTTDKPHNNEIEKKLSFKRKNSKKEETKKNLPTKANTTITDSSKEEKKEIPNTKKNPKENKKKKILTLKEKENNKTIDMSSTLNQKKTKNLLKRKKVKNSFSQKNVLKLKGNNTSRNNFPKNKITNNFNLSNNRTDSTNNLLLSSENFIKSLLTKYMDGTDNIINEDLEPFNNIDNNEDYENFSFLGDNTNEMSIIKEPIKTEVNTIIPKEEKKQDIKSNEANLNNNNENKKTISNKNKKKIPKINNKSKNIELNQIKTNIYSSFAESPTRSNEVRNSMNSKIKFTTLKKKPKENGQKKQKSFTNNKKGKNDKSKTNENKESALRKKILYSNKIINNMNKLKQNKQINELEKKESLPISVSNLKLDTIFENNKNNETISHHYLVNTVSAKNKMVDKKINSLKQNKNSLNSLSKIPTIYVDSETNVNLFRLNRTPKVKNNFKTKEKFSFNNSINNNMAKNNLRKYSFRINREFTSEFNNSGMSSILNPKFLNGKIDDYLITKELGKGSYAVVKLALHKTTKNKYAIKIYSKYAMIDPQKRKTVKNEINILKQIDNENVMKLYEVIDTPSNLYLVLEYINGISLLDIIKNEKYHFLKEQRAKKIFLQVVKGISFCHKNNIFHRDIKLENILVLKDDTIKIIDFGFGVKCNRDTYQKLFCGTPSYMAPEIVKKEKYIACYSDIWSLGVLFFAMLYGIFPFKGKDEDDLFEKINEAKLLFPEYNPIGEKTRHLFEKIFVVNPIERISLDEMINMLEE